MMLAREINTDGWITKLGRKIGTLFSAKNQKNPVELIISEKEIHNRILLRVMCNVSYEVYETEWEDGLEYDLWLQVLRGNTYDGVCLRYLSEKSGGWWIWSEERNKPEFISIRHWSGHYDCWSRKWKTAKDQCENLYK